MRAELEQTFVRLGEAIEKRTGTQGDEETPQPPTEYVGRVAWCGGANVWSRERGWKRLSCSKQATRCAYLCHACYEAEVASRDMAKAERLKNQSHDVNIKKVWRRDDD